MSCFAAASLATLSVARAFIVEVLGGDDLLRAQIPDALKSDLGVVEVSLGRLRIRFRLEDGYLNGYPDRNAMGFIQPTRIQVKLLKPDLALALTWWSVSFPSSKQKVVGNTTMNLQKFDDGWKIVVSHTSAVYH
jgi:hypothetical protein